MLSWLSFKGSSKRPTAISADRRDAVLDIYQGSTHILCKPSRCLGRAGPAKMQSEKVVDSSRPHSRVRQELDTARFSWFHVKAILVAGVGCACLWLSGSLTNLTRFAFSPCALTFSDITCKLLFTSGKRVS